MSRQPTDESLDDDKDNGVNAGFDEQEGFDPRCFEQVSAALASSDVGAESRERIWARIRERVASPAPAGTETMRSEDAEWIALSPLVSVRRLRVDPEAGIQTVLVRAAPGGCIPGHRHRQDEEFIVLEGECHIGGHHLRAGDAHFASAGSWHDDITTKTGVLVLVRGEYRAPARA